MYSAHFLYSESKDEARALEFKHFREHIERVRNSKEDCSRVQILAGDFNFQSAKEQMKVAHYFIDFRLLDAGPTTVAKKKSHYDHILVSETLRMPHYYIYPGFIRILQGPIESKELIVPYSKTFYPRDREAKLRKYEPSVRSYELSDHLLKQIEWEDLLIGTWNMEKHKFTSDERLESAYTSVLSLFSVLAVQELLSDCLQDNTVKYGRSWICSDKLREERLAFAYDKKLVIPEGCRIIELPKKNEKAGNQRSAYMCVFRRLANVLYKEYLVVVNVHIMNDPNPTTEYVNRIIDFIRTQTTVIDRSKQMIDLKDAYIMGDFNLDSLKNKFKSSAMCIHTVDLVGFRFWTFSRIFTKQTLDYIFTPFRASEGNNIPGGRFCSVINPELERVDNKLLIPDRQPQINYSFIGSWKELSDHYPVFMKFDLSSVAEETDIRKRLGVVKQWS